MDQSEKAALFYEMHQGRGTFVLPNAWDVISARLFEKAGAPAVATASAAIAWAQGVRDGEYLSRDEMIAVVGRITRSVDLPVSADLERGYGETPEQLARTIEMVIKAGAVGANIEDSDGCGGVIPSHEMSARLQAARQTANQSGLPFVLNARVDNLYRLGETPENRNEAIIRANRYLAAGATCIFLLTHSTDMIEELVEAIKGPVNILAATPDLSLADYEKMGVKRITTGPYLLGAALGGLERNAREMLERGTFEFTQDALSFNDIQDLLA